MPSPDPGRHVRDRNEAPNPKDSSPLSFMNLLLLLQSVLVSGGTVHTMVPGEAPRVADVLVVDGRIEAVGEGLEAPEGAEVVDATGRHVVPGLMDGMIHHDLEHDPLYVHAGITLVRDLGNDLGRIFLTARPAVRDNAPGPELHICGAVFDGVPPATTESIIATTALEIEDKLWRLLQLALDPGGSEERSIDFASFHLGLPEEAWRRLVELGHEIDLDVWGPVPRGLGLSDVLAARQSGLLYIESLLATGPEGRTRSWADATPEVLAPAVEAVGKSGIALTPLMRAYAVRTEDPGDAPSMLVRLSPQYASQWRQELEQRRPFLEGEYLVRGAEVGQRQRALLLALHEAGVPLVPGSGTPNPWLMPGTALHEELAIWVEAGIPPIEVLRHATAGAAQALGIEGERGTLRAGLVADLLVVGADPRKGLATLRRPTHVLLRGRVLERAELDGLLARLIDAQAEVRARDAQPIEVAELELPEGEPLLAGYVESSAYGQRFSGERYAVVREPDGVLAYLGRVVTPGGIGADTTVLSIIQRVVEVEAASGVQRPRLVAFDLQIETAGNLIGVEGRRIGGQFHVRRTLEGVQIDNHTTPRPPLLVDAGSVTAALILAQYAREEVFDILYFEDLEPAGSQWILELRPNGILAVGTTQGPLVATFTANGAFDKLERVHGRGRTRTESREAHTFDGPGLPLPKERVFAEEATSTPPPTKDEKPPPPEDQ